MKSRYDDLTDDEKLLLSIEHIERGNEIPEPLRKFLIHRGLYQAVTAPKERNK